MKHINTCLRLQNRLGAGFAIRTVRSYAIDDCVRTLTSWNKRSWIACLFKNKESVHCLLPIRPVTVNLEFIVVVITAFLYASKYYWKCSFSQRRRTRKGKLRSVAAGHGRTELRGTNVWGLWGNFELNFILNLWQTGCLFKVLVPNGSRTWNWCLICNATQNF